MKTIAAEGCRSITERFAGFPKKLKGILGMPAAVTARRQQRS